MASWYESGLEHIWLPYSQMKTMATPCPVVSTKGCRIKLADGRELIDGIASWWSACHGYNHPHIMQAMQKQLEKMPHVMFGGLVHEPALTLASRLAAGTGLPRVFFADSGSVAVEVALKMALQYHRNIGAQHKDRFICFRGGYHGDTLGAMGVSDPEGSIHAAFKNNIIKHYVIDIPSGEYGFAELDVLLDGIKDNVAGLIMEPLVQGAGGMLFHSADTVAEIHRLCKKHGIIFIADEIATGFGRTGNMFACNEAGITPDIMCLGKALTGGAITLAATLASDAIFNAFLDDDPQKALMHGPTYMANPLACSAANASLDLFDLEPRLTQIEKIEQQLAEELEPCRTLPHVTDVRVKGAIGVVELEPAVMNKEKLRAAFVEAGTWIRPFDNIVYLTPSFTINEGELTTLTGTIYQTLKNPA